MRAVKSFSGGVFSEIMRGRDEFSSGAIEIKNMIPILQGPVVRRGGTVYVAQIDGVSRLEPFIYNENAAYIVCFSDKKIKIFSPKTKTFTAEIVSPYSLNDIEHLWVYQIQDIMWIAHENYQPRQIVRTGEMAFLLKTIDFKNGPYLPQNTTETTLSLTGTKLTSSAALFTSADVNRWVNLKTVANSTTKSCDFKIISVENSTSATVSAIEGEFHSGTASKIFRLGAFNDSLGWPEIITLHQQRLVCVKSRVVYFSKTEAYTDFKIAGDDGVVASDNGFRVELAIEQGSDVQFTVSMESLIIGTGAYIYNIRSTTLGEALTPSNATYARISDKGACGLAPVVLENGIVFCDIFRRSVNYAVWSSVYEEYNVDDITKFSKSITHGEISGVSYCKGEVPVLWFTTKTGRLIGCTFSPAEKVCAWFNADVGGNVVSISAIPNTAEERYDLYLVVERSGHLYFERMTAGMSDSAETTDDAVYLDCASVFAYDEAVQSVSGLERFAGKTVQILANGSPLPERVVEDDGSVLLEIPSKKICVGMGYESCIVPSPLRMAANDETDIKRITKIAARLYRSVGMSAGVGEKVIFKPKTFRYTADKMDTAVPLFSGNYDIYTGGFCDKDAVVWVGQNQPLPLTVLAIYVDLEMNGGNNG